MSLCHFNTSAKYNIPYNVPLTHCYAHNSLPLTPILSQTKPAHTLPIYFFTIQFHIILQPTSRSSFSIFPSGFPSKTPYFFQPPPTLQCHSCVGGGDNYIQHSPPWKATSSYACQEILFTLSNPKVLYCAYNGPSLVPILNHIQSTPSHPSFLTPN